MPLLDLLKKKDRTAGNDAHSPRADPEAGPVFTFMRSDTNTQEVISPPTFSSSESSPQPSVPVNKPNNESRTSRLFGRPRSNSRESGNSGTSGASTSSHVSDRSTLKSAHNSKRISERFGLRKHEVGSSHVPSDLPEITVEEAAIGDKDAELQWEKRATILAQQNERSISRPGSSCGSPPGHRNRNSGEIPRALSPGRNPSGVVASRNVDDDLQKAIRLHEEGHLEEATKLFERLADPHGANNALSQVLYGLALRHGWGCQASPAEAVTYLSAAASNAAAIEELALQSGKMKGGAAKGELVIAIYELANCFRNGWGVKKDPTAAQKYYQTAAELGDTDSMNEVARCYLEGFGCKKDRVSSPVVRQYSPSIHSDTSLGSNKQLLWLALYAWFPYVAFWAAMGPPSCNFNRLLNPLQTLEIFLASHKMRLMVLSGTEQRTIFARPKMRV